MPLVRTIDMIPNTKKTFIGFAGIRSVSVLIFALGLLFSPLSLEAGQKKSGKSKKSSTSLTSNKKSSKSGKPSKSGKSGKPSKSGKSGGGSSGGSSSAGGSSGGGSPWSPATPAAPATTQPSVEQLLQDILTNSGAYKNDIAVSEAAFTELQLLVSEFGVDDIIETLKSGNDTAPFFNALKNTNVSSASDLISKLKDVLSSQGLDMEDFIYWASPTLDPAPDGLTNVRGGVIEAGAQIGGQVAAFLGQRVQRFQIAKYETTWSEWKSVRDWAKNNGYDIENSGSGEGENYPVRQVNWFDALKWCNAKSEKEGLTPVYQIGLNPYKSGEVIPTANSNANGYRLPTELEWEWAARGGLLSNGYIFSGSNNIDTVAWYYNNSGSAGSPQIYTKPILTKLPNELGIYDMSGNVSEWCFDTFFSANTTRAYSRGGSSSTYDVGCTVIVRAGHYALASRQVNLGFRVARNASVYTAPNPQPITISGVNVITYIGSLNSGFLDGRKDVALFDYPKQLAVDSVGNVYVADFRNNRIRKITPSGDVTTLAGSGEWGFSDGVGSNAKFYRVFGIAVDSSGNVYVADENNQRIRKITPSGVVFTLAGSSTRGSADGNGVAAQFSSPTSLAVDSSGNVYVTDSGNNRIRKITPYGYVTTLAVSVGLSNPRGIAVDGNGNVYVADSGNSRICKITPEGVTSILAGSGIKGFADGEGSVAEFHNIEQLAVDGSGNIYAADSANLRIRKITPQGFVSTLAGSGAVGHADGVGTSASFSGIQGVALDSLGNIFVSDSNNNIIRKITISQ